MSGKKLNENSVNVENQAAGGAEIKKNPTIQIKFPTETIIKSKKLKGKYHQDFMRALLPKEEYSMEEAIVILEKYFKTGGVS